MGNCYEGKILEWDLSLQLPLVVIVSLLVLVHGKTL